MTLKESLAAYIERNLIDEDRSRGIREDTPLIDEGIIDSMGLMSLVMFIEEQTGIRIPDDEVVPDNFQTVASMERMVRRLQSNRAAAPGTPGDAA